MPLTVQTHSVGPIAVVACTGTIAEAAGAAALEQCVTQLLPMQPHVVLDLAGVSFIDSAGIGLLIRLFTRARASRGDLKVCAAAPRVAEVIRITQLQRVLGAYDTEVAAVAAFYEPDAAAETPRPVAVDMLCVDSSLDVLAYVRQVLEQAGYGVMTASNLSDAMTLLRATRPKAVVIGAALREAHAGIADRFNQLADTARVVQLSRGFSTEEAGDAARHLLEEVKRAMAG